MKQWDEQEDQSDALTSCMDFSGAECTESSFFVENDGKFLSK